MKNIIINSVPEIKFAHIYSSEEYHALLPAHRKMMEISLYSAGNVDLESDGERYSVYKNCILINLYTHPLKVNSESFHCHHTVAFKVDFDICDTSENALQIPQIIKPCFLTSECARLIDEIIKTNTLYPAMRLKCSGLFLQLLSLLDSAKKQEDLKVTPGEAKYSEKAKNIILESIHEPVEQREIARKLSISPEHLCRIFKKAEGMTLIHFANKVKLDAMVTLMKKEKLSLAKAAHLYGYTDPNYASKLFKKMYGKNITDQIQE